MKRSTAIIIIICIILCAYPFAVKLFANGAIDRTVAETQNRSIAAQLGSGTRYFDLRVQSTKKGLVFYHSVFNGNSYTEARSDILDFLAANPSEFVILDFQHFKGDGTQELLLNDIKQNLADVALSNDSDLSDEDFISSLTLSDVRGKCLIFWGDEETLPDLDFVFLRNNDGGTRENSCLHSFYIGGYNKKSSSWYIENALPEYIEMRKEQDKGLFVLQGQLTDGLFIRGPRLREAGHNRNMSAYIGELANSSDLGYINIIMRDYTGPSKNAEIIALNAAKGLYA